jgi:hypothetical protein
VYAPQTSDHDVSPQITVAALTLGLGIVFDWYCLRDLLHKRDDEVLYFTPVVWAALVCITTPLGGLAYLIIGRVKTQGRPL